jgi:hypothetical protein
MQGRKIGLLAAALLASTAMATVAQAEGAPAAASSLEDGFQTPPNSARPRVWWHWMNGNITKDGIRKDIEWMSRIGVGGLQNFDAQLMTPQIVEKRLAYMTPDWKDAFRYAAAQADQHGLELAIASSPGWSETGGPWVQPRDAMKKLVWSETVVEGGRRFDGALAPVPQVTGPFQDMGFGAGIGAMLGGKSRPPPTYSGEVAVLAYRLPQSRTLPAASSPAATARRSTPAGWRTATSRRWSRSNGRPPNSRRRSSSPIPRRRPCGPPPPTSPRPRPSSAVRRSTRRWRRRTAPAGARSPTCR